MVSTNITRVTLSKYLLPQCTRALAIELYRSSNCNIPNISPLKPQCDSFTTRPHHIPHPHKLSASPAIPGRATAPKAAPQFRNTYNI
jgi:hypothetical protein